MSTYVYAPAQVIIEGPGSLPGSWSDPLTGDTHRLDAQTPEELGALGWLAYSESRVTLTPHQKYAPPIYQFDATSCTAVYAGVDMTPEEIAQADASEWYAVRAQRDAVLLSCDWVGIRSYELGQPMPQAWKDYRQALRDITLQPDPYNIVWPVAPPPPEVLS